MVHFYVDDGLGNNSKARGAGLPAMGLWVMAGAHCGEQLTEGLVPSWYVRSFGPTGMKHALALVAARLWHGSGESCDSIDCPASSNPVPPEHFAFHDWAKVNTRTKASVEAERAAARERQRRHRSGGSSDVSHGVTSAPQSTPSQRETSQSVTTGAITHVSGSVDNYPSAVEHARARLRDLGQEPVSKSQAARVVDAILSRAATTPRNPERYVKVALNRDPTEWLQYMLTGKEPA